jgi:hypothetical protein
MNNNYVFKHNYQILHLFIYESTSYYIKKRKNMNN